MSPAITTGAPSVTNPYGSVTITPVAAGCTADPAGGSGSGSFTLVPGTHYCGLTVSGTETLTIPSGVYYLVGTLGMNGRDPG